MTINYYPPSHPVWKLLRLVVVCVTLVVSLNLLYHNGWAPKDYITLINTLTVLGGYDAIKTKLAAKKRTTSSKTVVQNEADSEDTSSDT